MRMPILPIHSIAVIVAVCGAQAAGAAADGQTNQIDQATVDRCLTVLRAVLNSDEFWPSMHAAEGLTTAGHGDEVRAALMPRLPTEQDDQHRCGLARELVRSGDRAKMTIMLGILEKKDDYAHAHAAESLYKVNEIGDGQQLLALLHRKTEPRGALMAAAALGRWGNAEAMRLIRDNLTNQDPELARVAAWILGRIGTPSDIPALHAAAQNYPAPLSQAYFQHALAALNDPAGRVALAKNLESSDPAIRTYAAAFATDTRATELTSKLIRMLDDPAVDARIRAATALLSFTKPPTAPRSAPIVADVFRATAAHPRYSEGSVIALNDGDLLCAITEFQGTADAAHAHIVARRSSDQGRTWDEPFELQANTGQQNVMSVTLRRLTPPTSSAPWPIGMFYLVKNSPRDLRVMLRISTDETAIFGPPIAVSGDRAYYVMNNDRVTRLSTGRLIAPVSWTSDYSVKNHFVASCFVSDDAGHTWRPSRNQVDYAKRGAMEPEVLELRNGRLLMIIRTQLGHVAISHSEDQGMTWSKAKPWTVRAPESPATLRRIPSTGDLLIVWNDTFVKGADHGGARNPLTWAISDNEGATWKHRHNIENVPGEHYSYPSVLFHAGRVLMTYYVRDGKNGRISARFRSLPIARLYDNTASD